MKLNRFILSILLRAWISSANLARASNGMSLTVDGGFLVNEDGSQGAFVGTYTSSLQSLIDTAYPAITNGDIAGITFFDSSELRYLNVRNGSYLVDVTLQLPSMFVLKLEETTDDDDTPTTTSLALAQNASATSDKYPSLVAMYGVSYSAVIGGTYDARLNSSYECVHVEDGSHNKVSGITGFGSALQIVHLRNGNRHEVAYSTLDGGDLAFRCIWCLAMTHALVHDNTVRHCTVHVIDFDAYTTNSAAWSNLVEENNQVPGSQGEGIFVEETATNNFIFNNTVRNNGNNGIALYSSAVGPVTGNIIAANTLEGNANFGLNSGGAGGSDPTLHSGNNIFVANVASDSGGVGNDGATNVDFNILHGTVEGDFWTGNKGTYVHSNDPHSAANVSVLDP